MIIHPGDYLKDQSALNPDIKPERQSWVRMVKVDGNIGFGYQFIGDTQVDAHPKLWFLHKHEWRELKDKVNILTKVTTLDSIYDPVNFPF